MIILKSPLDLDDPFVDDVQSNIITSRGRVRRRLALRTAGEAAAAWAWLARSTAKRVTTVAAACRQTGRASLRDMGAAS